MFQAKELDKLLNYADNVEKRILSNFKDAQQSGGVFGDSLDMITPEDTGALIESKHFAESFDDNSINLYVIYGGLDVTYASAVHSFSPFIFWTNPNTEYHFLDTYFTQNKDQIFKELTE